MALLPANETLFHLHAFPVLFIQVQEPDLLELCLYLLCGVFCFFLAVLHLQANIFFAPHSMLNFCFYMFLIIGIVLLITICNIVVHPRRGIGNTRLLCNDVVDIFLDRVVRCKYLDSSLSMAVRASDMAMAVAFRTGPCLDAFFARSKVTIHIFSRPEPPHAAHFIRPEPWQVSQGTKGSCERVLCSL